jgi:putative membrane protein
VVTTVGFGALYELLEAAVAWIGGPEIGEAFLALQGDPWDTHKDMSAAFAGALIAMSVTAYLTQARTPSARASGAGRT